MVRLPSPINGNKDTLQLSKPNLERPGYPSSQGNCSDGLDRGRELPRLRENVEQYPGDAHQWHREGQFARSSNGNPEHQKSSSALRYKADHSHKNSPQTLHSDLTQMNSDSSTRFSKVETQIKANVQQTRIGQRQMQTYSKQFQRGSVRSNTMATPHRWQHQYMTQESGEQ